MLSVCYLLYAAFHLYAVHFSNSNKSCYIWYSVYWLRVSYEPNINKCSCFFLLTDIMKCMCMCICICIQHTYTYISGYRQISNIGGTLLWQQNSRSLRCSWNTACRRCSNYIFILYLTPGFNRLRKDSCKMRQETFKFWDSVRLILETWR